MKKYIKPSIDIIAVDSVSHLMTVSEVYTEPGDKHQLAPGRKTFDDDLLDDGDDWW